MASAARLHRLARGSSRRSRSSHPRGLQHPRRQGLSRRAHPGRAVVLLEDRRAGTKPTAISSRPRRWRNCSAASASARSRPSCSTAIPCNSAATPSGPSPWPDTPSSSCSTAAGANGSWRSGRCRATCRISRRRLSAAGGHSRRCASAATMCASICVSRGGCCIDLRSPEEYSGERVSDYSFAVDHGAERTGRIPGAVHLYFKDLLNDGRFVQIARRASRRARRTPASRRKNSTTSSAIAG